MDRAWAKPIENIIIQLGDGFYCVLPILRANNYSSYSFILNQANTLAEFKAIAKLNRNRNKDLDELALEYGILLPLYNQVFLMRYNSNNEYPQA